MALRDQVTGLPTLELLQDRMDLTMAQHQRVARKAVVLLLESKTYIDPEFRQVISQRMQNAVRNTDTVAMIDDATFAVLLTDLTDSDNAIRVVDTLIQRCQQPYQNHGETLRYRPSIGLSVYPDDAHTVPEWFEKAYRALDIAKAESNGVYKFYTEDMNVRAHRRRTLSLNLKKAWARDELHIYGQPIFEKNTNACTGVELLLRWDHPDSGIIEADQFADIAQLTGLWSSACEKLLHSAIEGLKKHPNLRWSWNAPSNIEGKTTDDILPLETFANYTGDPKNIGLEISESLLYHRPDIANSWIQQWTKNGGFIALDDCGLHPLSGTIWHNLNIHEVKTSLHTDPSFSRALAKTYNWRHTQKRIDAHTRWQMVDSQEYGQGNVLCPALPLEILLSAQTITMQ